MHHITAWLAHYGYWVLFIAPTMELIAVPLPGETLMTYCGLLVQQGRLNWGLSILVASSGVITGITIAYCVGYYLGAPFFKKYGKYVHLDEERISHVDRWFERYGEGVLLVSYYIPGVRHLSGYFAGITRISYRKFALFAYPGAVIWVSVFISLGRALGLNWHTYKGSIEQYLLVGATVVMILVMGALAINYYKEPLEKWGVRYIVKLARGFTSLGRVGVVLAASSVLLVTLCILLVKMIRVLMYTEFSRLDTLGAYLSGRFFPESWSPFLHGFSLLTSLPVLTLLPIVASAVLFSKSSRRFSESLFAFSAIWGGVLLGKVLQIVFNMLNADELAERGGALGLFPDLKTLASIATFGFLGYLISIHMGRKRVGSLMAVLVVGIAVSTGASVLASGVQSSSSVIAGGLFGGIWLCINILILELVSALILSPATLKKTE